MHTQNSSGNGSVTSYDIGVLTTFGSLVIDPDVGDDAVAAAWDAVVIDDGVSLKACGIARHMVLRERPSAFYLWERASFPDNLTLPDLN